MPQRLKKEKQGKIAATHSTQPSQTDTTAVFVMIQSCLEEARDSHHIAAAAIVKNEILDELILGARVSENDSNKTTDGHLVDNDVDDEQEPLVTLAPPKVLNEEEQHQLLQCDYLASQQFQDAQFQNQNLPLQGEHEADAITPVPHYDNVANAPFTHDSN